jgi:hypothetical protein
MRVERVSHQQPQPLDAPHGLCPACMVRVGLDSDQSPTNGPDSGPPLPVGGSVVQVLGGPRVQLREPAMEPPAPIEQPDSSETRLPVAW